MANLAIRGHATRSNEVIEILEMLGGVNRYRRKGNVMSLYYYIGSTTHIYSANEILPTEYFVFTLEEFLEKFPYKVGDEVIACAEGRIAQSTIQEIRWNYKLNKVEYKICSSWCDMSLMQPGKKEIMESKPNLLQQLKEYFDNTPRDVLEKEWNELSYLNEIGPTVDEYLEYVKKYRKSNQYPKTYKECCDVLGLNTMDNDAQGYEEKLIIRFQELLIARNAYWEIIGEQMGLGKPWNQDYNDRCFVIANNSGNIHTYEYHGSDNVILAFPTEEIRDTFYKNFKDLIEGCKELL